MRIVYTFYKKGRFWLVKCASDNSIKESIYNSRIEAINKFFVRHDIEYFDIVIPLSIPIPLEISKSIRKTHPVIKEHYFKPIPVVYDTEWGNKPIPDSTVEFKYGMKWIVAIPPYKKQNVFYLRSPLPGTYKFASGKGSAFKTIQIFNGTLEHEIFIDLGWSKAHIYLDGQELRIEFTGGQEVAKERWLRAKSKRQSIFSRFKGLFFKD